MNRSFVWSLSIIPVLACTSATLGADLVKESAPYTSDFGQASSGKWDGVFIGAFGGYLSGTATSPIDFDLDGFLVGVNAGTNFTLENGIVLGVVGDLAWSNVTDDDVFAPPSGFDVNWVGSIRGRVGYDAGLFMPYLTAGLAFANSTLTAFDGSEVDSNTHVGWTIGGGFEFKATENLAVDLSYRYSDYGAKSYGVADWEFGAHQVTAGLNWYF